ncbi:lysylphosphatidylglycerol synthase transmembrane domain-containing protein [Hymenobacter pini]|uniref:lysylphosphatidylglycerol synthase transmembrane domain-containing protein n=1 Tax=Hymenobacter pini TaxID=2880879 RepID=UPI001CF30A0F|nr:lysylphosphatidylglycerol synthase domain-containing protein [Hymenobacter pini]MCA8830889.1 flippase-like domain-containing protein [Hymenobacter pini]
MPSSRLQSYAQTAEPPAPVRHKGWIVAGKLGITLLTLGLLWHSVVADADTAAAWRGLLARTLGGQGRGGVLAALLLMPVNWGLEAWKWWRLALHLEPVSFRRSFRAVLVGLTLGFVTPNRVGDYAGRIMELKGRRLDALGAVFLGRYCQLVATVAAGTVGLLYFLLRFYLPGYPAAQLGVVVLTLLINVGILLPLYHSELLVAAVQAVKPLRRFSCYLAVMPTYPARLLTRVLLISGLRYLVFCLQFGALLWAYGVQAAAGPALAAIAGTFLLKSLVPSLNALADVGVRELSATHLFGMLGQPVLPVLSASLSLWVLNIAVPSAIGLVFVLRLKVLRKRRSAPALAPEA